jgi:CPA1 family monovalent cation:H+ antiporter
MCRNHNIRRSNRRDSSLFTSLTLSSALLFGALISATDPVAVIALFNEIKAPKRLLTLIDGESIFNDATAIVLFTILMATPISSLHDAASHAIPGFISFILVLCGGVIIGLLVGAAGSLMLHIKKGDMILQFTVTLITAYVSFILADKFKASGVISTLCAGLVFSATSDFTIRRRHRESLHHFWEYFAFTANSFVFLLLGFTELSIFHTQESIQHSLWIILLSIPVIVIARACVIYILIPLYNKFTSEKNKISPAYQAILLWGGLRGAVPVALVFSIPEEYPHRIIIMHLTFGFILFTLLFQGTTIKFLMNLFGITPEKHELEGVEDLETKTHSFSNEYMSGLILKRLLDIFSEEGFFVSKEESDEEGISWVAKKKEIIVIITQDEEKITFTYRKVHANYLNTVLYETLLEFDKSLKEVENLIRPEQFAELIKNDTQEQGQDSLMPSVCKYIESEHIISEIKSTEKKVL